MINRSQWILDIERDLRLISERLHVLEDQFEHDGVIVQLAETLHVLATELEHFKTRRADDAGR